MSVFTEIRNFIALKPDEHKEDDDGNDCDDSHENSAKESIISTRAVHRIRLVSMLLNSVFPVFSLYICDFIYGDLRIRFPFYENTEKCPYNGNTEFYNIDTQHQC